MKPQLIFFLALLTVLSCPTGMAAQTSLDDYFHGVKKSKPLICGHRGGSGTGLPENSLALFTALAAAFGERAVMIELDVRRSADGELYVLHDATLGRTTTGTDSLHRTATPHLRRLRLKTDGGAVTEEKIPAFGEVLTWLTGRENVFLMVDVKGDCWRETTALIRERKLTDRCLLLTFSPADTKRAYDLLPDGWISTLVRNAADYDQLQALDLPAGRMVAYVNSSTPRAVIRKLKRDGLILTTDVSELRQGYVSALTGRFYRAFVRKNKLGILITDFPVGVRAAGVKGMGNK